MWTILRIVWIRLVDEIWKTQKRCLPHCRPQSYPHFAHIIFRYYYNTFYFFKTKKQKLLIGKYTKKTDQQN
jgi:hypothetical protein